MTCLQMVWRYGSWAGNRISIRLWKQVFCIMKELHEEFDINSLYPRSMWSVVEGIIHHTAADLVIDQRGREKVLLEAKGARKPREAGLVTAIQIYKDRAIVAGAVPLAIYERAKNTHEKGLDLLCKENSS